MISWMRALCDTAARSSTSISHENWQEFEYYSGAGRLPSGTTLPRRLFRLRFPRTLTIDRSFVSSCSPSPWACSWTTWCFSPYGASSCRLGGGRGGLDCVHLVVEAYESGFGCSEFVWEILSGSCSGGAWRLCVGRRLATQGALSQAIVLHDTLIQLFPGGDHPELPRDTLVRLPARWEPPACTSARPLVCTPAHPLFLNLRPPSRPPSTAPSSRDETRVVNASEPHFLEISVSISEIVLL